MFPIQEQKWGQVNIHKWSDLSIHFWECFRISLMTTESNSEARISLIESIKKVENETTIELDVKNIKCELINICMNTEAEMSVNVVVSKRNYKQAMLNYLPWYEQKSIVFQKLLEAYDKEFREIELNLEILLRNLFIQTAIEGLDIHEKDLGIRNSKNIINEKQRREQIYSRYRASFDQTTEATIKKVASAYSNGDVEISTTDTEGIFEMKFISKGIPDNMKALNEAIEIIIPAHLGVKYVYSYTPWEELTKRTWGECESINWRELRVWEGEN